jgi:hypothetical protein
MLCQGDCTGVPGVWTCVGVRGAHTGVHSAVEYSLVTGGGCSLSVSLCLSPSLSLSLSLSLSMSLSLGEAEKCMCEG